MTNLAKCRVPTFDRLDRLDDACRRAIDAAKAAYMDAIAEDTAESIERAIDRVHEAFEAIEPVRSAFLHLVKEDGKGVYAGAIAEDGGRELLPLYRVLRKLRYPEFAAPASETRIRCAQAR